MHYFSVFHIIVPHLGSFPIVLGGWIPGPVNDGPKYTTLSQTNRLGFPDRMSEWAEFDKHCLQFVGGNETKQTKALLPYH